MHGHSGRALSARPDSSNKQFNNVLHLDTYPDTA